MPRPAPVMSAVLPCRLESKGHFLAYHDPLSAGAARFQRVKAAQYLYAVAQGTFPLLSRIQSLEERARFVNIGLLEAVANGQQVVDLSAGVELAPGAGFCYWIDSIRLA